MTTRSPLPEIEDPTTGQRVVFLRTAEQTAGELLECDLFVRPGGFVPLHAHPRQEERFEARAGRMRFRLGRARLVVAAGETVVVPPGTAHWFRNEFADEAQFRVQVRPAWRTDNVLLLIGLARDGLIRMRRHGYPTPLLQAAVLGTGPLDEVCLPWLPLPAQKALFTALAPLGRALGYRSVFPEYGIDALLTPEAVV